MSTSAASNTNENAGVAFAIVLGAGAATAIGAAVVFFPSLVKLTSQRVLAASLGLSAGVMTYVSFVEIFAKSVSAFTDANHDENMAYIYSTLSFFGGVVLMKIIDVVVTLLSGGHHHHHHHGNDLKDPSQLERESCNNESEAPAPVTVGCSDDPVAELNEWHKRAEQEINAPLENTVNDNLSVGESFSRDDDLGETDDSLKGGAHLRELEGDAFEENSERVKNAQSSVEIENAPNTKGEHHHDDRKQLSRMGLNTALAIAIHNFPEGLATFVAALDDPSVGVVLGIAIGIHNIPEGLCVALPTYYATGNRCKAFMWGCLSGASEPIAALLGWLVLANSMSDNVYAILFGLVSGMMVIISLKELIPTAHRYDSDDTVVTYSVIAGMAIIALSLVLFKV
mmetsp:Transcript_28020/g.58157  ORF Transcript_28020/g.58157 Transcript_28020/m.58157 type:complete len:397 (-) Transcript_28020:180-1370(-)